MFVVVHIRASCRVVKHWYGCIVAEQSKLIDLYHKYSSGQLDCLEPVSSPTGLVTCAIGHSKTDNLVRVFVDVPVGEAVSSVGNYLFILQYFIQIKLNFKLPPASLNQEDENLTIWP